MTVEWHRQDLAILWDKLGVLALHRVAPDAVEVTDDQDYLPIQRVGMVRTRVGLKIVDVI
jgi:hypothetical protein